jgi:hypothetical protein
LCRSSNQFLQFDRRDIQIHDQALLAAAGEHALQLQIVAGVDFLMRHPRWHIDEIPRSCFSDEFQLLAPAQACNSAHHIDDTLELAVVMRTGLGLRIDRHRTGPQLGGAGFLRGDGRAPAHAQRLGRGIVELVVADDPDAVVAPATGR